MDNTNIRVVGSLQSQFNQAIGKRKAGVLEINPTDLNEASANSKKQRIDNTNRGPSILSNVFEGRRPPRNTIESFRTPYLDRPGGEEYLPESQPKANTPHVIQRHMKPIDKNKDAGGVNEILYLNTEKVNDGFLDVLRLSNIGQECNPLNIVNTATLNYFIVKKQLAAASKNLNDYLLTTAWDYMKHYRLDGVPQVEIADSGDESRVTSGFGSFNNKMADQRSGGYKMVTMITKGKTNVFNFGGRDSCPGAEWHAVVKKVKVIPDFRLCAKQNIAGIVSQEKGSSLPNPNKIFPYMLHYVSLPNGGELSMEHLKYEDELGRTRYDAHHFKIGQLCLTPFDHQFKPVDAGSIKPFTDSFETYNAHNSRIMLPTLLMDCNDGIYPIL
jgi:hypothetical protein